MGSIQYMGTRLRLAIALLTWNRKALFECTYNSLRRPAIWPFTWHIVDQGSTDGTAELVKTYGGLINQDGNRTIGHGMNLVIGAALQTKPDIVLFTADDYEYKTRALNRLMAFWQNAPTDVAIVSCNLEPDYPWNQPQGVIEAGGQRALIRATVPGSNWSFRATDWPIIGPIREATGDGEDLEVCHRLTAAGYKLCALDLCNHIGEHLSTWGNRSWQNALPLDRVKWGI